MRRKFVFLLNLILFLLLFAGVGFAKSTGQTSGVILKLPISAQNAALADISAAYNSPFSFFKNPGIYQKRNFLVFSFSNWILDSQLGFGGMIYRKNKWNIAIAMKYLNYGKFIKTVENSSGLYAGSSGIFRPYSNLTFIAFSHKQTQKMSVGAGFKFLTLNLGDASSNLVPLLTLGMYDILSTNSRLGISFQNIKLNRGLVVYRDVISLPTSLSLGASYENINLFSVKSLYIDLFSELQLPTDADPTVKAAVKVKYKQYYALLGVSNKYAYIIPFSFGIGAHIKNMNIAFSYLPSKYDYIWISSLSFSF